MYSILLVDDMPVTVDRLASDIDWASIQITQIYRAYGTTEAERILSETHIDILLTDIKMPGKDGLAMIRDWLKQHQQMGIVLYSAYDEFSFAQQAIELGVSCYLTKPTAYDVILSKVKLILERQARKTASPRTESSPAGELIDNALVRHAMEVVDSSLSSSLTVQDIALLLHVHPNHLSRVFKQVTGVTPIQYITSKKIERAKELLGKPGMRIGDIVELLGYESVSYFSRLFKRETGYSPREYINRYL